MKLNIVSALSFLFITFCTILFVNVMNFNMAMQKVNAYHYATVHEIESSDFASTVMQERMNSDIYKTQITDKSIKEDMHIYEVKTKATLHIPVLNYEVEYVKESLAR